MIIRCLLYVFPTSIGINALIQRWSRGHKARGQGHKKKKRGQGQLFREQTLSRPRTALPRTDPLEAKDRNAQGQGHKRKSSPKTKKRSSKFFSGVFHLKTPSKIFFSGDLQNFSDSKNSAVLEPRIGQFSRT